MKSFALAALVGVAVSEAKMLLRRGSDLSRLSAEELEAAWHAEVARTQSAAWQEASAASSLAQTGGKETQTLLSKAKWDAHDYVLGSVLGKGAYGTVYEAAPISSAYVSSAYTYAWKTGQPGELAHEGRVMSSVIDQRCGSHVMSMPDRAAKAYKCVTGFRCGRGATASKAAAGFLLPRVDSDLQKWLDQAKRTVKRNCKESVRAQLQDGLNCLHAAGYSHDDLKPDNVFYKGLDSNGCPAHVYLGDFGLSRVIGSRVQQFDHYWKSISVHLHADLFGSGTVRITADQDEHGMNYVFDCGFDQNCAKFRRG